MSGTAVLPTAKKVKRNSECGNPELETRNSDFLSAMRFTLKRSAPQVPPIAGRSSSLPREMRSIFHWGGALLMPYAA